MDVSQPTSICVNVGGVMVDRKEYDSCVQADNFAALLRGPPQMERLLTFLAEALVIATRGTVATGGVSHGIPCGKELVEVKDFSSRNSTNAATTIFPSDDRLVQVAYLDDLCLHLSTGVSCEGMHTTTSSVVLPPLPLPVRIKGGNQKMRVLLMRLSRSLYWRSALLIPLLRRWWSEGSYSYFSTLLLQTLLTVLGEELLSTDPENGCVKHEQRPSVREHDLSIENNRIDHSTQVMREVEEVVRATGSFRGICLCIEFIFQKNVRLLLEQVERIAIESSSEDVAFTLPGDKEKEIERTVDICVRSAWEEMFAFLLHCTPNIEEVFCEPTWVFLMTLLSGYAGAVAALKATDLSVANHEGAIRLQLQCLFIEKLQKELQYHLTVRLSMDCLSLGQSNMTVYNTTCRLSFFWKATMETELAPELLPPVLLSTQGVRAWAWKQAATAWGHALRLVQSFVQVQEAVDALPVGAACTAAAADSVASSIQRCHCRLFGDYVERLRSTRLCGLVGMKRPREAKAYVEGEAPWLVYANDFFLRVYNPSCFTILSLVKQDTLLSLLRQLHSVTVNAEREAVRLSLEEMVARSLSTTTLAADLQKKLLRWHTQCVHYRVLRTLREDAPLLMCLLFAVFTLLERLGKTNIDVHSTLRQMLLPILSSLCGGRNRTDNRNDDADDEYGNNDKEDDDAEDYFECQQSIMMLLASGFLVLPWDLRGLRLRLLVYQIISVDVQDCFSAEEALARVDHFFEVHTRDGQQTLDDVVVTLYHDVACDPVMQLLTTDGNAVETDTGTAATKVIITESTYGLLLRDTPLHFPAPCGTLLLLSIFRTLSIRMMQLRAEWEQQVRLAGESSGDYLGRQATFCTTRDVTVFRVLVQLAHRMVFGFQVQPVGLLRLWISYLNHLFTHVIPPLTEDDEMLSLASHTQERMQEQRKQRRCEDKEEGREVKVNVSGRLLSHPEYRRSPRESSQGELRAVLGELLADLMLMPLVDSDAAKQCPAAVPHRPGTAKWLRQQTRRSQDLLILQRVLPVMVLREVCFTLNISLEDLGRKNDDIREVRRTGRIAEQSFLGALGIITFCQRLELFIVPGSITDKRVMALLQALWSVVEGGCAEATM